MRAVNLISKDTNRGSRMPSALLLVAALAPILAIGIVAGGYSYEHGKVAKSQDELASIRAQVVAAQPGHPGNDSPGARCARHRNRRAPRLARWGAREPLCALPDACCPRTHPALRRVADIPEPGIADARRQAAAGSGCDDRIDDHDDDHDHCCPRPPGRAHGEPERVDDRWLHLLAAVGRPAPDAARPLPMLSNVALTSSTALASTAPATGGLAPPGLQPRTRPRRRASCSSQSAPR